LKGVEREKRERLEEKERETERKRGKEDRVSVVKRVLHS